MCIRLYIHTPTRTHEDIRRILSLNMSLFIPPCVSFFPARADEIVVTAENVLFAGGLNTDLAGILMEIKGKATPDSVAAAIEKGVAAVVSDMSALSTRLTESETKVSMVI